MGRSSVSDRLLHANLLFDFYGQLLTEKQRCLFQLYYQDDLSLGEISLQHGVSRQAVHDILKRSQRALEEFEEKLGLVRRFQEDRRRVLGLTGRVRDLERDVERLCSSFHPLSEEERLAFERVLASVQELRSMAAAILSD